MLVLSLFPGIGLLDMALEEEGFCVVRGPDLLWGGDIRRFHPPSGRFDGVIGGPPCQAFSPLVNINIAQGRTPALNLIPEFERVVREAAPRWFLMENVERAPAPSVAGYAVQSQLVRDHEVGGRTLRARRFSFGTAAPFLPFAVESSIERVANPEPTVTTNSGGRRKTLRLNPDGTAVGKQGKSDDSRLVWRSLAACCVAQGLPADFLEDAPFTAAGKRTVVGNGVPLPMGRAVAAAVKRALAAQQEAA